MDLIITAYTRPRAKTRLNGILFATSKCKCQTVGKGSAQVTRSHAIPQATMLTKTLVSLRQFPGTPASNVACTGVQRKVETKMEYDPRAILKARLPITLKVVSVTTTALKWALSGLTSDFEGFDSKCSDEKHA